MWPISGLAYSLRSTRLLRVFRRSGLGAVHLMDFIEQIFGFSPDGGSGLFETLLFAIPIAGIAYLARRRRRKRRTP